MPFDSFNPFTKPKNIDHRPGQIPGTFIPRKKQDMRVLNSALDVFGVVLATIFLLVFRGIPLLIFLTRYWWHKRYVGKDISQNRYYMVPSFSKRLFPQEKRFVKGKSLLKKPGLIPPEWQKWLDFEAPHPPQKGRSPTFKG